MPGRSFLRSRGQINNNVTTICGHGCGVAMEVATPTIVVLGVSFFRSRGRINSNVTTMCGHGCGVSTEFATPTIVVDSIGTFVCEFSA